MTRELRNCLATVLFLTAASANGQQCFEAIRQLVEQTTLPIVFRNVVVPGDSIRFNETVTKDDCGVKGRSTIIYYPAPPAEGPAPKAISGVLLDVTLRGGEFRVHIIRLKSRTGEIPSKIEIDGEVAFTAIYVMERLYRKMAQSNPGILKSFVYGEVMNVSTILNMAVKEAIEGKSSDLDQQRARNFMRTPFYRGVRIFAENLGYEALGAEIIGGREMKLGDLTAPFRGSGQEAPEETLKEIYEKNQVPPNEQFGLESLIFTGFDARVKLQKKKD